MSRWRIFWSIFFGPLLRLGRMGREKWRCSICDGWGRGVACDTHTGIVSNESDAHKIFWRGLLGEGGRITLMWPSVGCCRFPLESGKQFYKIAVRFLLIFLLWCETWTEWIGECCQILSWRFRWKVNEGVDQIMRARVIQTRFEVRCMDVLKTCFQIKESCFWITPGCWCYLLRLFTFSPFSVCKYILRWKWFTFLTLHCEWGLLWILMSMRTTPVEYNESRKMQFPIIGSNLMYAELWSQVRFLSLIEPPQ